MWVSHRKILKTFYLLTLIVGIWLVLAQQIYNTFLRNNDKNIEAVNKIEISNDVYHDVYDQEDTEFATKPLKKRSRKIVVNLPINKRVNVMGDQYDQVKVVKSGKEFLAKWSDLETRPLPEWYDRAKIGIMVHWGVYSVPAFQNERFWMSWNNSDEDIVKYMKENYPPEFTYKMFAPMFRAQLFDPNDWATLFRNAGARYVVLTSKHHDGFTLFPSQQSPNWNSVEAGPCRDIVRELSTAVREKGLEFGVYYSLYEWHNPTYQNDKQMNFSTYTYRDSKMWQELKYLINNYKPSIVWADGAFEASDTYWNSTKLLAWLYNESPVRNQVVVNDRWGRGLLCSCGDFYSCRKTSLLQRHKWEKSFSLDALSWGYRQDMKIYDILPTWRLIWIIIKTVSSGGNVLINVGATKDGTIPLIFQDRLIGLGKWLAVNGEAIFDTSPWFYEEDRLNKHIWYTCKKSNYDGRKPTAKPEVTDNVTEIYAMFTKWPKHNVLRLADVSFEFKDNIEQQKVKVLVQLLDRQELQLDYRTGVASSVDIYLPNKSTVISNYAWVLKISVVPIDSYEFNNTVLHGLPKINLPLAMLLKNITR